jgi:trehalose synthase
MIRLVDVQDRTTLADYSAHSHLSFAVQDLKRAAEAPVRRLADRTVWMVNSTAQGGGVAEMLPKVVTLLRELGVDTQWAVIDTQEEWFFTLTKRLHNLLHGAGDPRLRRADRDLYAAVSRDLADALKPRLGPQDVLVVHDPQPAGMGAFLADELGIPAIWRCHIGLDEQTPATEAAWDFLMPWLQKYDRTVFSLEAYIPPPLNGNGTVDIINPAIDPLSDKNRPMPIHKLTSILKNGQLAASAHPSVTPPFPSPALRLQRDGALAPATQPDDIGILFRPILTQVSRWDRLKGFAPLLQGFARLKTESFTPRHTLTDTDHLRIEMARLVLAGPSPDSVADDPEGQAVFQEICALWHELPPDVQRDITVLALPMDSRALNAKMVNALQRCSTIVVQNSLREGFGLTVTEGMWKEAAILGTRAAGIREQVNDGEHGRLLHHPEDPEEIAQVLGEMLHDEDERERWSRNAKYRVTNRYLVFTQVQRWLEVAADTVDHRTNGAPLA